jgi:integrase
MGVLKRSGVKYFRLHDLRHTFATRAAEAGIALVALAAMLGHSRTQMVLRYAHPTEEHQFNAMRKIEAIARGKVRQLSVIISPELSSGAQTAFYLDLHKQR